MLDGLLDARKSDPASLATGAFAGRIIGKATVEDCEVENVSVTAVKTNYENKGKIVGQGGFVGHVEGETSYDVLSNTLGVVGNSLADILNAIPGLGLGDLVTVLLDNGLLLKKLIPTGYVIPEISRCAVNNGTLTSEAGKIGVGGFAGSVCGTVIRDSTVKNCANLDVFARELGGGFAGVTRDAFIKQTLSGLGINVARAMHPQSELIRCSIENSNINVHGGKFLGGFTGALANSYGINDTIDAQSNITVSASQDYAGGFTGSAMLGTLLGMSAYLVDENDLLGVVKGLLTGLLGQGADQSLLELGGVASSSVMGCQLLGNLTVSAQGSYAGGFLGRGNGVYLTASSEQELSELPKYKYGAELPINTRTTENTTSETRGNYAARLKNNTAQGQPAVAVYAGRDFAGGIAGYLTSANVGGLLGDTAGIGQFLGFTVSDTTVRGTEGGFSVETGHDFAGGGIGWAVGGDVRDDEVEELLSVKAHNRAGGFVGKTNMKYLLDTQVESWLVDLVLDVVNELVKMLYLPEAERVNLLNINIPGLNKVLALRVLSEGDLLYVNLLGLRVGVSLSKSAEEGGTDVAIVTIGDSAIRLNCTENGINKQEGHATVEVNLIKANRTRIEACHANSIAQATTYTAAAPPTTATAKAPRALRAALWAITTRVCSAPTRWNSATLCAARPERSDRSAARPM